MRRELLSLARIIKLDYDMEMKRSDSNKNLSLSILVRSSLERFLLSKLLLPTLPSD